MFDINTLPRGVRRKAGLSPKLLDSAPDAQWEDPKNIANSEAWRFVPKSGQIFLGAVGDQLIGIKDNRHLMTIAGSRAGKGVSAIIPNLIEYPGSILVIDPKGENAARTANQRGRGSATSAKFLDQTVYVLDPFGYSGHKTSRFNPLSIIQPESDTAVDDAALIAEGLVIPAPRGEDRHWTDAARNFLKGLILYVCIAPSTRPRDLTRVRKLLTLNEKAFDNLLESMSNQGEKCNGVIRRAANALSAKSDDEASSIISTAIEQTAFLDSPSMGRILEDSEFELRNLKRQKMTVYLCLPAGRMASHNRWLRIMVNLAVHAMEEEKTVPDYPVLFIMDEFAVLDHMESIEKAAGQIAGFDVRLWPIIQDLSQLESIYEKRWETFMGNAGLLQFFGNNDLTTLTYISKRLGNSTILRTSQSATNQQGRASNAFGDSSGPQQVELLSADEVGRYFSRQSGGQVVLWPGERPIALSRVEYMEHEFFDWKYDPDPKYPLRRRWRPLANSQP